MAEEGADTYPFSSFHEKKEKTRKWGGKARGERERKMDLKQVEEVVKDDREVGGLAEKKPASAGDHCTSLQVFLDRVPICSIPALQNPLSVLELKTGDLVGDAIHSMYDDDVSGAPVADDSSGAISTRVSNSYVGLIDFASMLLWSLEESAKAEAAAGGNYDFGEDGIFSMLQHNHRIAQTKVGELAKSFRWDPFFPVTMDHTLMHVMLLLSTHRLQILPVTDQSNSKVVGFVTQNEVMELLLRASGLEWFDHMADKALSEFRFEHEHHPVHVYGDQSIAEGLHVLWENLTSPIAVLDRETERLIGGFSRSDVHLLLEDANLVFWSRKNRRMEEFIYLDRRKTQAGVAIKGDPKPNRLRNTSLPRMDSPVTNRKTDTLKQAMKNLAGTGSNFSFLIDELQHLTGVLTVRDIITKFAPPCVDSRFSGGGFFESALEQSGCQVKNEALVCDR